MQFLLYMMRVLKKSFMVVGVSFFLTGGSNLFFFVEIRDTEIASPYFSVGRIKNFAVAKKSLDQWE